jgi:AmmeMemoRadiSam system protein B
MFYPADPVELAAVVDDDLAAASRSEANIAAPPKAVIAPHAGYVYSGPVAASAYARLRRLAGTVTRVVLLGPAHQVPVRALGVSSAEAWSTPLGIVPVDTTAVAALTAVDGVEVADRAHAPEHSLEVHLPFLQRVLGDGWSLVPLIVGGASPTTVADALDTVWGGPETLVVVSSDLSHYHPYDRAAELDRATAAAIVAGRAVRPDQACGAHPVDGLLVAAERHDLDIELVDLRSSGDTAGDRDRVVGYGSFVLRAPEPV